MSQAVRIGDQVRISGQGGWDANWAFPESLEEEIERACDNVELALNQAGACWRDVVEVTSFHASPNENKIGDDHVSSMVAQFRRRLGDRAPIWTCLGVKTLGHLGMRVEIVVLAVITTVPPAHQPSRPADEVTEHPFKYEGHI